MSNRGRIQFNKIHQLFIVCVLSVLLSGCDSADVVQKFAQTTYDIIQDKKSHNSDESDTADEFEGDLSGERKKGSDIDVYDTDGEMIEKEVSVIDEGAGEKKGKKRVKASDIPSYISEFKECYAYSRIPDKEKRTYSEIYSVIRDMRKDIVLSSKDTDEIDHAFRCVMVDHPEIFYVKGYSVGKYMRGDKIDRISISGTYTMSKDDVKKYKKQVEAYVTNVIENAPAGDDYEKIKYVYEYIIHNTEYDETAPDNQNILSVVIGKRTVCQGYAKMTQLLLNRMGLVCTLVNGTAKGASGANHELSVNTEWSSHVWNIVKSDGRFYNVDTTWGDASFTLVEGNADNCPTIDINYEFLLVDDAALVGTHDPNPVVKMPICNSTEDNYYVRSGCYFSSVDKEQLRNLFDNAYTSGEIVVSVKTDNADTYKEMKGYLIGNQAIFNYIVGNSVKYVEYPERNLLLINI